jgi:hypothetical protein
MVDQKKQTPGPDAGIRVHPFSEVVDTEGHRRHFHLVEDDEPKADDTEGHRRKNH